MNRREAIILCCCFPIASVPLIAQEKQTSTGPVSVLSNKILLKLDLTNVEDAEAGVTALFVSYKGKQVEISAKEIWEALTGKG